MASVLFVRLNQEQSDKMKVIEGLCGGCTGVSMTEGPREGLEM